MFYEIGFENPMLFRWRTRQCLMVEAFVKNKIDIRINYFNTNIKKSKKLFVHIANDFCDLM